MSVDRKLMDHFVNTPVETMAEGKKLGGRIARALGAEEGSGGETLGELFGMIVGAVAGGARILSPVDAAVTLGRTNDEIDNRSDSNFEELGR